MLVPLEKPNRGVRFGIIETNLAILDRADRDIKAAYGNSDQRMAIIFVNQELGEIREEIERLKTKNPAEYNKWKNRLPEIERKAQRIIQKIKATKMSFGKRFGEDEYLKRFHAYDEKLRQVPLYRTYEEVIKLFKKKEQLLQDKLMVLAEAVQKGDMAAPEAQKLGADAVTFLKKYREIIGYLMKEKDHLHY